MAEDKPFTEAQEQSDDRAAHDSSSAEAAIVRSPSGETIDRANSAQTPYAPEVLYPAIDAAGVPPELVPGVPQKMRPSQAQFVKAIFVGPNGIRAGWRLCIYVALIALLSAVLRFIVTRLFGPPAKTFDFTARRMLTNEGIAVGIVVAASAVMAIIERQKWGNYGLPLRRAFGRDFWIGCAWGFAGLSLVLGILRAAGAYRIDGLALAGGAAVQNALLWALVFLLVGCFEEFLLRGYLLYTLASGITFWPAAVLTSAVFLLGHVKNPGETWFGLADVFVIGMFFCLTVWRTGDLWFAVGLHAAWDWGQTFFYSVPDSGMVAPGHLFNIHMQGPAWLSGGSVGPEGSAVSVASHVVYFALFVMIYKQRKWGKPAAVSNELSAFTSQPSATGGDATVAT